VALTWTKQADPGGTSAQSYSQSAVDPINGISVLMNTSGALYRSTDGFTSSSTVNVASGTPSAIAYGNGVWLVATSTPAIRRSTDNFQTFSTITNPSGIGTIGFMCFAPGLGGANGTWLAVGQTANDRLYSISTDGGQTWSAAATSSTNIQTGSTKQFIIWDGTNFQYSGLRDQANSNSIVATFDGVSTWSTTNIDSIFGTLADCNVIYNSQLATYMAFANLNNKTYRVAGSIAGLNGATSVTPPFPTSNALCFGGAMSTDLFWLISGNNAVEVAELHGTTLSMDTTVTAAANRFAGLGIWDQKNGKVMLFGSGTASMVITAPYGGFAATVPSVTVAAGEGGIQLSTTEGTGGLWDVNGIVGGNSTIGTISATGFYTAPQIPPSQPVVLARNTTLGLVVSTIVTIAKANIAGQTLTPTPQTNAPAGIGGDVWGANGGGITPNSSESIMTTMSRAQRRTTYQIPGGAQNQYITQQTSKASLVTTTPDSNIPAGGN